MGGINGIYGEINVVVGGEPGQQAVVLEHHHAIGSRFGDGVALEGDGAAGGSIKAGDHVEEGGFAAAGVSDQADEFALVDGKVDAVEDGGGAVGGGINFGDSIDG